jgi:hypothetical protein
MKPLGDQQLAVHSSWGLNTAASTYFAASLIRK